MGIKLAYTLVAGLGGGGVSRTELRNTRKGGREEGLA